jgi:hypothetical protein
MSIEGLSQFNDSDEPNHFHVVREEPSGKISLWDSHKQQKHLFQHASSNQPEARDPLGINHISGEAPRIPYEIVPIIPVFEKPPQENI